MLKTEIIQIEKKQEHNVIIGTSHFIKTVHDLEHVLKKTVPGIKFGLAFCEASGKCLVRKTGTDKELTDLAVKNAEKINAGHSFIIVLDKTYPIQVLNQIKQVQEVCTIHCATANPVKVIILDDGQGRGIIGAIDGYKLKGVETKEDEMERKEFLKKLGYV